MELKIIKYKEEQRSEILTIWEKSVLATHDFLSSEDFQEIKTMLQGFDFEALEMYCLVYADVIIGFTGIYDRKVEMLFLHPDYFGKGFGKELLNFAITNLNVKFVDVNEQNSYAKIFYGKAGFTVFDRTEKDDMGKNYPILKMILS